MENVINVVNFMLSKGSYTPKQIQKMLYYAYSLYLIKNNDEYNVNNMNKLFDAKFEAWQHGPVIRKVYDYMKNFGNSNTCMTNGNKAYLNEKRNEVFIEKILMVFGRFSGTELENMTHLEDPWINAYKPQANTKICNNEITDEAIFNYYYSKYKVNS